jgi:hypothetical protein
MRPDRIREPEKQPLIGNDCCICNNTRSLAKKHTHATMEELLEAVFSMLSVPRLHKESALSCESVNIPVFLITLPRTSESCEIFKLMSLCHIAISVEA